MHRARGFSNHHFLSRDGEWWCKEAQRQWDSVDPRTWPSLPQAAPGGTARQKWSTAKHSAGQLLTGVPADCQSGGARGEEGGHQLPVTTPANCQSREQSPTLGTQDCLSGHGQLSLQNVWWPVREAANGYSDDSCFSTHFLSLFSQPGHPIGPWGTTLSDSQLMCFSGLLALPAFKDRPHCSGLSSQTQSGHCDLFTPVTQVKLIRTNQN